MIFLLNIFGLVYVLTIALGLNFRNNTWNSERKPISRIRFPEEYRFTDYEKKQFIILHNKYRQNLTPPAADIQFMEWNDDLARIAQDWADKCIWDHGNLKDPKFEGVIIVNLGNNVDITFKGNVLGRHPYKIGAPCSKCSHSSDVGLCSEGLCVTREQCKKHNLDECVCNLKCHNCGIFKKESCKCECKDGWDELDCSIPCADKNKNCHDYTCSLYKKDYNPCRKTCKLCKAIDEKNLTNTCCNGKICSYGFILNVNSCACDILCPGPICDKPVPLPATIITVIVLISVFMFVICLLIIKYKYLNIYKFSSSMMKVFR
ncbi:uncharacterized protein [Centruroides vittatus]|uniref:uncharacterized protein isoform X2 n=1 Tax=Centruroides vittatus TaxID=120091 RepID=UPI00350F072F